MLEHAINTPRESLTPTTHTQLLVASARLQQHELVARSRGDAANTMGIGTRTSAAAGITVTIGPRPVPSTGIDTMAAICAEHE